MSLTIRARVKGGLLEPLERIDLPEGEEITITLADTPANLDLEAFRHSAGAWKSTLDAEALIERIYEDRLVSTRREPHL